MNLKEIKNKKEKIDRQSTKKIADLSFEIETYLRKESFTGKEIFRAVETWYNCMGISDHNYIDGFGPSKYVVELLSNIVNKREDRAEEKEKEKKEKSVKTRAELMDLE